MPTTGTPILPKLFRASQNAYVPTDTPVSFDEQARLDREQAKQEQQDSDNTTVWDGIGAVQALGTVGMVDHYVHETGFTPDPDFGPKDIIREADEWRKRGVTEDQMHLLERATSQESADYLYGVARSNMEAHEELSHFGLLGQVGLSLTDPGMVALDAIAAPLGAAALGGRAVRAGRITEEAAEAVARSGRLRNAVRSGIVASGENFAFDEAESHYDPSINTAQALADASVGFAFGGVLGFRKSELGKMHQIAQKYGKPVEAEAAKPRAPGVPDDAGSKRVDGANVDTMDIPTRDPKEIEQERLDEAYQEAEVRPAFRNIRRDISARFGKSKSALVRQVGRKLVRESVGFTDRNIPVEESASQMSKRLEATLSVSFADAAHAAFGKYRKELGINAFDASAREDFFDQVGRYMRNQNTDVHPEAKSVVNHVNDAFKRMAGELKAAGVNGFENLEHTENYLPRSFSRKGFEQVFGDKALNYDDVLEKLVKPAMRRAWEAKIKPEDLERFNETKELYEETSRHVVAAKDRMLKSQDAFDSARREWTKAEKRMKEKPPSPKMQRRRMLALQALKDKAGRAEERLKKAREAHAQSLKDEDAKRYAHEEARKLYSPESQGVDEELLDVVAKAWLNRAKERATGVEDNTFRRPLAATDTDEIRELLESQGVPKDRIDALVGKWEKKAEQAGVHARAKHRIDMDESWSADIASKDTGKTHTVAMADLLENNVERLLSNYVREMSGWVALKRRLGVGSRAELDALKEQVLREAKKAGDNTTDVSRMLDIAVNYTLGHSTEENPGGSASRWSRLARGYNHLLLMGQVGYTMLAEAGPVMGYSGVRTALGQLPEVRRMFKRMEDGSFSEDDAKALMEICAPGTDWTRNPPYLRTDDLGGTSWSDKETLGRVLNKVDNTQESLKRVQSVMSGLAPMHAFLQRWSARATMARFIELANKDTIGRSWENRLRNWGMTPDQQKAIFGHLKGLKGVTEVDKVWHDMPAEDRNALSAFMWRVTRHQVIEGDVGDSLVLQHSAAGKITWQFRNFLTSSYTGHLLNAAHLRDWQAAQMIVWSTLMAGVGYSARAYVNTIGDRKARKEQLSGNAIWKSAIQQSSYSSVIPAAVDTVWADILHNDPVFRYSRSTGLDVGVKGVPLLSTSERILKLLGTPAEAIREGHLSRQDVENISRLFWLNNLTGIRNALDASARQFPNDHNQQ